MPKKQKYTRNDYYELHKLADRFNISVPSIEQRMEKDKKTNRFNVPTIEANNLTLYLLPAFQFWIALNLNRGYTG